MRFEEKELRSAEQAEITVETNAEKLNEEQSKHIVEWFKTLLGDKVKEVKISKRLIDSPAAIVSEDKYMTTAMRKLLKSLQKEEDALNTVNYNLEINPASPIICELYKAWDNHNPIAEEIASQIYDNACIAAGLVEDFSPLIKRMNNLMEKTLKQSFK